MSTKKTELKVAINCEKCKIEVLKAITKLTGVDSVAVIAEKGTVTVVGTVDPVCVVIAIRKSGKFAEITSVGPPKEPDPPKPDPPKPDPPKPDPPKPASPPLPACCKQCQLVGVSFVTYDSAPCSIL